MRLTNHNLVRKINGVGPVNVAGSNIAAQQLRRFFCLYYFDPRARSQGAALVVATLVADSITALVARGGKAVAASFRHTCRLLLLEPTRRRWHTRGQAALSTRQPWRTCSEVSIQQVYSRQGVACCRIHGTLRNQGTEGGAGGQIANRFFGLVEPLYLG